MLASLYGIYLLYLGLPVLMKTPQEKAVVYVAAAVGCAIAVFLIFGIVSSLVMGGPVGMIPGR